MASSSFHASSRDQASGPSVPVEAPLRRRGRADHWRRPATAGTPSSAARSIASSRRADIQGLRALAVLLVVAFHAGLPIPGGFTGVDVFFAISGFVITAMLTRELESSAQIELRAFYVRRVRRLLPALAAMLLVVSVLGSLLGPAATQRTGVLTGAAASLFSSNVYLYNHSAGYFDPSTSLNPLLHTWTLGVEEQFYVMFPLLLLFGWVVGLRILGGKWGRGGAAAAVGAVSAASFVLSLQLSGGRLVGGFSSPERFAFYGSPARAWEFGAGALIALGLQWVRRLSQAGALAIGAAGFAALAAGAVSIHDTARLPGTVVLLPVCATCALLAAGGATPGGVSRSLGTRPAVWLGNLSYSWYLWHWPLIVFANALWPGAGAAAPVAALLSLLPAWLSYRFVESPIRFGHRLSGRKVVALALACVIVPVSACAALLGVQKSIAGTTRMSSWELSELLHADVLNGCDSATPLGDRVGGSCTWTVPGAHGTVILVGDSNAGQFTEPVVAAAGRSGLNATVATFSSCPFVDLGIVGTDAGEARCRRFDARTLSALVRLEPSLVIIAGRTDRYIEEPTTALRDRAGLIHHAATDKARLWEQALRSILNRLNRAGVPVILIRPIPTFARAPHDCAVVRILLARCGGSAARKDVDERLRRSARAENRAVATATAGWTLGFEDEICSTSRCSTVHAGVMIYRDANHLSVEGALDLTGRFARAISAHAVPRRLPPAGGAG